MEVGGTPPRKEVLEPCRDAYRDIGGRATQEAKAERRPRTTQETKSRALRKIHKLILHLHAKSISFKRANAV